MVYASTTDIRTYCGFTVEEVDDGTLLKYSTIATHMIIEDFTCPVIDEELSGSIDGSNKEFEVAYTPIADSNGDTIVNPNDVVVYTWTDSDNPATKSTVSVQTVYPREGIIVLTTAPATTVEKITCDYRYTWHEDIRWDLVTVACSYLTGFLYAIREYAMIPDWYNIGALRFRHTRPYLRYLEMYYEIMNRVKGRIFSKEETEVMEVLRSEMST